MATQKRFRKCTGTAARVEAKNQAQQGGKRERPAHVDRGPVTVGNFGLFAGEV